MHIIDVAIAIIVHAIDRIKGIGPDVCAQVRMGELNPFVDDADIDGA